MSLLSPKDLHRYQHRATSHLLTFPNAMLWLDMGLGKSVVSLTAFVDLQDRWEAAAALVVGPKRVVEGVWAQEAKKWSHTKHLRFSLITGTADDRKRALSKRADLYLTNYENLEWLVTWVESHYVAKGLYPPFDMLILDEVTKVKTPEAKRSLAAAKLLPYMRRRVGLTGEPAANGYKDLFGQYLAVDGGARLGSSPQAFRDAFLMPLNRKYVVTQTGKQQIKERIHDITLEMSADDYLTLPPIIEKNIIVDLPPKARAIYDQVESEYFAELDGGAEIEAQTEATKDIKILQVAGGASYVNDSDEWVRIHDAKIDALEDLMEEQGGAPVLLAYAFRHEAERIAKRFNDAEFMSSKLSGREFNRLQDKWNAGDIPLLCGHPASIGHGLNLQFGGTTLVWFGLNWSLELYNQFNARLAGGQRRRGRIFLRHILAADTMDFAVKTALEGKAATQADLKRAVNEYRANKMRKAA